MKKIDQLRQKLKTLNKGRRDIADQIFEIEQRETINMLKENLGCWFNPLGYYEKVLSVKEERVEVIRITKYEGKYTIEQDFSYTSDYTRNRALPLGKDMPKEVKVVFDVISNQIQ